MNSINHHKFALVRFLLGILGSIIVFLMMRMSEEPFWPESKLGKTFLYAVSLGFTSAYTLPFLLDLKEFKHKKKEWIRPRIVLFLGWFMFFSWMWYFIFANPEPFARMGWSIAAGILSAFIGSLVSADLMSWVQSKFFEKQAT